jgi:hypothetical protein|tara:strand:+ start:131 stop:1375 length:1245 start_codon:yes stop_codon:yes gene_type:complete
MDDLDPPENADDRLQKRTKEIFEKFPDEASQFRELLTESEFDSLRLDFAQSPWIGKTFPATLRGSLGLRYKPDTKEKEKVVEMEELMTWLEKPENFRSEFKDALQRLIERLEKDSRNDKNEKEEKKPFDFSESDKSPEIGKPDLEADTFDSNPESVERIEFDFEAEFEKIMNPPGDVLPFPKEIFHWNRIKSDVRGKCENHLAVNNSNPKRSIEEIRQYIEGLRDYAVSYYGANPEKAFFLTRQKNKCTEVIFKNYLDAIGIGAQSAPLHYSNLDIVVNPDTRSIGRFLHGAGPELPLGSGFSKMLTKAIMPHERSDTWGEWFSDRFGGSGAPGRAENQKAKYRRAQAKAEKILSLINKENFDSAAKTRVVNWAIREIKQFGSKLTFTDKSFGTVIGNLHFRIAKEKRRMEMFS